MNELNSLLTSRRNEWLYGEIDSRGQASFKTSDGYLSKLFLCVEEIFRCCFFCQSLAQKTELAIQRVFQQSAHNVPTADRRNEHIFAMTQKLVERKKLETACIDNLQKCKTIWGRSIKYTPTISENRDFLIRRDLEQQFAQAESVVRILPYLSPVRKGAIALLESCRKQIDGLQVDDPYSSHLDEWALACSTLADLKSYLVNCGPQNLDISRWEYNTTNWTVLPGHADLTTAGGYRKEVDYLKFSINLSTLPANAEEQQKLTDQCVKEILLFVKEQLPGEKKPISIDVSSFWLHSELRKTICIQLIDKLEKLMSEYPEHFVHRYSLYNEAKQCDKNKDPGICLSRITGNIAQHKYQNFGKNSFVAKQPLRADIKELLISLKDRKVLSHIPEYQVAFEGELSLSQRFSIYRALSSVQEGADYGISMREERVLCHRLVIEKIFPMLNPHGGFDLEGIAEGFDLSKVPLEAPIPIGFESWVCRSIMNYAYTQEHPNLSTYVSDAAKQAYSAYFQCLDYLTCGQVVNCPIPK